MSRATRCAVQLLLDWFLLERQPTSQALSERRTRKLGVMEGINLLTLVFLAVAVAIFLKLRSVLGRRTGHEQTRFERYKAQQEAASATASLPARTKS